MYILGSTLTRKRAASRRKQHFVGNPQYMVAADFKYSIYNLLRYLVIAGMHGQLRLLAEGGSTTCWIFESTQERENG